MRKTVSANGLAGGRWLTDATQSKSFYLRLFLRYQVTDAITSP